MSIIKRWSNTLKDKIPIYILKIYYITYIIKAYIDIRYIYICIYVCIYVYIYMYIYIYTYIFIYLYIYIFIYLYIYIAYTKYHIEAMEKTLVYK